MLDTKPTRLVQLTDCHLFESEQGELLGLNTTYSLKKVLELIKTEQTQAELYLATGDLSQDGSISSYQRFLALTSAFPAPLYCLPGNHDEMAALSQLQDSNTLAPNIINLDDWSVILLDSTVPGKVPGYMSEAQLQFLDQALESTQGQHVMVSLHHQPVKVGCKWLDHQIIGNADALFNVLDRYSHIKALVWGHVHQDYEHTRNGVQLFSTPSTCVQFKPHSEDFSVDDTAPGYRWFDLYPNGTIESRVSRVQNIQFDIDYAIKGY